MFRTNSCCPSRLRSRLALTAVLLLLAAAVVLVLPGCSSGVTEDVPTPQVETPTEQTETPEAEEVEEEPQDVASPCSITITSPKGGTTAGSRVTIRGRTESGARVTCGGYARNADSDGNFSLTVPIKTGRNSLRVTVAKSGYTGNYATATVTRTVPKPAAKPAPGPSTSPTVYITNTGEKYHSDGCQYLRQSKIAVSLAEAKSRGYTPCSKCGPPQ